MKGELGMFEQIKKRCDAASAGPWHCVFSDCNQRVELHDANGKDLLVARYRAVHVGENDMNFIMHAREDIPLLLDEIDRLKLIIAEYQADLRD